MGREAVAQAEVDGEVGQVKALLETADLILRGDIRCRFPREQISDVAAEGDVLRFICDGQSVTLRLGGDQAARWAKAIAAAPPTLRAKLGLDRGARTLVLGAVADAALLDAIEGARVADIAGADMVIAWIEGPADLDHALAVMAERPALPLWTVYAKGPGFGDTAIRAAMRAQGWRDLKVSGVSARMTATRYGRAT
jgi:hypothetical protein